MRRMWLSEPLSPELDKALRRLEATEDVQAIAVMPDAHLAKEVCVGTVIATSHRIFPDAVGGDIGCGMSALAFEGEFALDEVQATRLLALFSRAIPIVKHRGRRELPVGLSLPRLVSLARRDGARQLGTLGRGNHFLELQRDDAGQLWLMVHSGSRAIGRALRAHALHEASPDPQSGLRYVDARADAGAAYLADVAWARRYAAENRLQIADAAASIVEEVLGVSRDASSWIDSDHNHVQQELVEGSLLWVHRKGASSAGEGAPIVIPGSMGSASYHVVGRGHRAALSSSSHGAGRAMSRTEAKRRISRRDFRRQTRGVWLGEGAEEGLRAEAPGAYKDIGRVMRAQRELVRIVRRLTPLLCFKGMDGGAG
ncbi:MAG: RtcB family protein [Myxococcota bacterium]